jgi:hypothetical protein
MSIYSYKVIGYVEDQYHQQQSLKIQYIIDDSRKGAKDQFLIMYPTATSIKVSDIKQIL